MVGARVLSVLKGHACENVTNCADDWMKAVVALELLTPCCEHIQWWVCLICCRFFNGNEMRSQSALLAPHFEASVNNGRPAPSADLIAHLRNGRKDVHRLSQPGALAESKRKLISLMSPASRLLLRSYRTYVHGLLLRSYHNPSFASSRKELPTYCRNSSPRATSQSTRPLSSIRSAFDPLSFIVAVAVSTGIAYVATKYTSKPVLPFEASDQALSVAPSAQQFDLVMAASMPPGRPGTLTADQEAKLKEMWLQTLDVFGVSSEAHTNGTATPSESMSPDAKKKKKGRLSMFKSHKNKGDSETSSLADGDNDKHGQTKEFQQALASQSPESLREAFWSMSKHDHPDALLLRFLRARKWDVQAAMVMMISTMHWRSTDMHVDDDIMKNGEGGALQDSKSSNTAEKREGEDFLKQLRMGKSFLHGADKEGRPCCYVRVKLHKPGEETEKSLERFTVYTIETARMMLRPPVDTAVSRDASFFNFPGSNANVLRHRRLYSI